MSKLNKITPEVYELASDHLKIKIDAAREHGQCKAHDKGLLDKSNFHKQLDKLLKKASRNNIAPYTDGHINSPSMDGFVIERKSSFTSPKTGKVGGWKIESPEKAKKLELLKEVVSELVSHTKPIDPVKLKTTNAPDSLMVNIPIGDSHFGCLAWGEECGDDYDLSIAESVHKGAVDMLIDQTPDARHCTIVDLGDFIHSDNQEGVTSRSGHSLDMDGRYHKVIRVAISVVLYYIEKALEKFEFVTYRPEVGNHNDIGALWMQEMLAVMFKNNPRVTIGNNAGNVFFWGHGDCYFMSHHGHQIKGDRLYQLFAKKIMDDHIQTKYRKIYIGHFHHKSFTENAVCEMQTYRTLAAKDAYSAGGGYHANRSITAEVWHKEYGEVSTVNVTIPMIKNI